jgi:uncharacterized membrane protein
MIITWQIAFAVVASIATICLTIFKILSAKRADNDKEDIAKLDKKVAILETRFNENCEDTKKERERLQISVDRLLDITYESLVKIAQEHDKK